MKRALFPMTTIVLFACGPAEPGAPPSPVVSVAVSTSSAAPTSAAAPMASADSPSTSSRYAELAPKTLARKATPTDLRKADDEACTRGSAEACRRMADRHRGYGAPAGCGVDRGRGSPFIKTIAEDTADDERAYTTAMEHACQLGDKDACDLAKVAFLTYEQSTDDARLYATRSDPQGIGILRFREKATPEWTKVMLDQRQSCITGRFGCGGNEHVYFHRDVKKAEEPKLSPERAAAYIEACKTTHDCDDLWMMIDKNRYAASDVEPIRGAFADTLSEACLAGECTCGHAIRYLAEDDPKSVDLAILGCNDGEAEGCYELARRLEAGLGIEKNEERASVLYHLACPDMHPREGGPGPRMGEYSKRACDRLADLASGGAYPPKNWGRAMYYANLACPSPGSEVDHAPCVRLGRFWATNTRSTGRNGEDARDAAYGPRDGNFGFDCNRPSVKDECDAFEKSLASVK